MVYANQLSAVRFRCSAIWGAIPIEWPAPTTGFWPLTENASRSLGRLQTWRETADVESTGTSGPDKQELTCNALLVEVAVAYPEVRRGKTTPAVTNKAQMSRIIGSEPVLTLSPRHALALAS